jgi:hypothetical protein
MDEEAILQRALQFSMADVGAREAADVTPG